MRTVGILASAVVSLGIIGAVAGPAQAAERGTAHTTTYKATKADKKFARLMHSDSNPDAYLYDGVSTRKLRAVGLSTCNLIKVYDRTEPAKDAIVDTLLAIEEDDDEFGTTQDGDAWLVVSSINSYCTKYVKTLKAF